MCPIAKGIQMETKKIFLETQEIRKKFEKIKRDSEKMVKKFLAKENKTCKR